MESALVKNRRDLIQLKNGYFRYHFEGVNTSSTAAGRTDFSFEFDIPPLNEMAFSDHYSQALVRISEARVINPNGGIFNEVFHTTGGVLTTSGTLRLVCPDITSRNLLSMGSASANKSHLCAELVPCPEFSAGRLFLTTEHDGITPTSLEGITELEEIGNTVPLSVDAGITSQASGSEAPTPGDPGDVKFSTKLRKNSWCVPKSNQSIFQDGVLASVPFGRKIKFFVRESTNNQDCCITSTYFTGAGAGGGEIASNETALSVVLEIQLLPNPTPED